MYAKGQGPTLKLTREAFGKTITRDVPTDIVVGVRLKSVGEIKLTKDEKDTCVTVYYNRGKHATFFGKDHNGESGLEKITKQLAEGTVANFHGLPMGFNGFKALGYEVVPEDAVDPRAGSEDASERP
jgi:hypothetical protein